MNDKVNPIVLNLHSSYAFIINFLKEFKEQRRTLISAKRKAEMSDVQLLTIENQNDLIYEVNNQFSTHWFEY